VALEVTRHNALALGVETRLSVVESNWLESLSGPFDLMVSNPPYIASGEISELAPDVQAFDPLVALDGGADGLGCYRAIALTAGSKLNDRGVVAVEIGAGQEGAVVAFFREQGFILKEARQDLGGVMRALLFGRG
jgi:release factor glutamine methyltransferase